MNSKNNVSYSKTELDAYIKKFKNKVYKSLCLREEGGEWEKFFETLINELEGFKSLFNNPATIIEVLSKMEYALTIEDYSTFRKNIFEILHCLEDYSKEVK